MGSTAERRAWGMTTSLSIVGKLIPRERAASICPTPMVLMPLMKFSDPNDDATRTTVMITQRR